MKILLLEAVLYLILSPVLGGFLMGLDRKITARLQGRVGPPLRQPFYDVLKLFQKENLVIRRSQNFYIQFYLILMIFTGGLFFAGGDLLLTIFALTLAEIFFVLGGYKASSPYSFLGAQRELLQIMAFEPVIILSAVGMYMVTGSFKVTTIAGYGQYLFLFLPGLLLAMIYVLNIKFRKSPFDLSTSHHAHQEIVKGITTEFSGSALGMIEIAHWYENVIIMGFLVLFFAHNLFAGLLCALGIYLLLILVDNVFCRYRWQLTLISCWAVTLVLGLGNIIVLFYRMK